MSETTPTLQAPRPLFGTERKDNWWIGPLLTGIGLAAFVIYTTWAGLVGEHYQWGPYLSPLYSPLIKPDWFPYSPAILILWAPGGFRLTCYYYRKAYYRAFFLTPPACAVGGRPHTYRGERALFLFQNLHRFFLYFALALVVILTWDAVDSFIWANASGTGHVFGMGVGSIVLTLNAAFIAFFTFGCNSLRHLVGGGADCYSCVRFGKQRYKLWQIVTRFNEHHMEWAWISLIWVGFTDLYIRLVSMGIITDLRIV
jgi:hypothetical protein